MLSAIVLFYQNLLHSQYVHKENFPLTNKRINKAVELYRRKTSRKRFRQQKRMFQAIIDNMFYEVSDETRDCLIEICWVQIEENLQKNNFELNSFLEMINNIFYQVLNNEWIDEKFFNFP